MARKLRKSVARQKRKRSRPKKKPSVSTQPPSMTESIIRDNYLYESSIKAFIISIVFLILSIWTSLYLLPFNLIYEFNSSIAEIISGVTSLLFFVFLIIAWGNALEIRGDVIEWKQILICVILSGVMAGSGGFLAFAICIFGAFATLTLMWYLNR